MVIGEYIKLSYRKQIIVFFRERVKYRIMLAPITIMKVRSGRTLLRMLSPEARQEWMEYTKREKPFLTTLINVENQGNLQSKRKFEKY